MLDLTNTEYNIAALARRTGMVLPLATPYGKWSYRGPTCQCGRPLHTDDLINGKCSFCTCYGDMDDLLLDPADAAEMDAPLHETLDAPVDLVTLGDVTDMDGEWYDDFPLCTDRITAGELLYGHDDSMDTVPAVLDFDALD